MESHWRIEADGNATLISGDLRVSVPFVPSATALPAFHLTDGLSADIFALEPRQWRFAPPDAPGLREPHERYARELDLVSTYPESDDCPVRAQT